MRILFLDDNQDRHDVFRRCTIGIKRDFVYNAQDAISRLNDESVHYDVIFLDHDLNHETEDQLNDDEEDGRYVARHLASLDHYKDTTVVIHSLNQAGRQAMLSILTEAGFSAVIPMPFAWRHVYITEDGSLELDPNR